MFHVTISQPIYHSEQGLLTFIFVSAFVGMYWLMPPLKCFYCVLYWDVVAVAAVKIHLFFVYVALWYLWFCFYCFIMQATLIINVNKKQGRNSVNE